MLSALAVLLPLLGDMVEDMTSAVYIWLMQADLGCTCWNAGCHCPWGTPIGGPNCPAPGDTGTALVLAPRLWVGTVMPQEMVGGGVNYLFRFSYSVASVHIEVVS